MLVLQRAATLATFSSSKVAIKMISPATAASAPTITSSRFITSWQWRDKHKRYRGRLDELPDWSYTDGRGYGPPSSAQKRKYLADQELGQTVVRRMKELIEAKKFK